MILGLGIRVELLRRLVLVVGAGLLPMRLHRANAIKMAHNIRKPTRILMLQQTERAIELRPGQICEFRECSDPRGNRGLHHLICGCQIGSFGLLVVSNLLRQRVADGLVFKKFLEFGIAYRRVFRERRKFRLRSQIGLRLMLRLLFGCRLLLLINPARGANMPSESEYEYDS